MWKLFLAIIAMSDTGSVSSNVNVNTYASQVDCMNTARVMTGRTVQTEGGHQFTVVVTAQCNRDLAQPMPPPMPPPQQQMFPQRRWP
jgi:hypothetical protein